MSDNPYEPPEHPQRPPKRVKQPFPYQKYKPWQVILVAVFVGYVVLSYLRMLFRE